MKLISHLRLSLRLRLMLLFLLLALIAWSCASLVAWKQTTHKLNELFDTQQMLFAKRLSVMNLDEIRTTQPKIRTAKNLSTAIWTMMPSPSPFLPAMAGC
jgi:hypothetical protein